jgi:arylsulfatase A-like enzyme
LNLVLVTIDTLRWDMHFAGNPRELSPNMDRLAARGVVFEHAYALSSYTGRAVGPLLAGRYPTETIHDEQHFTGYGPGNVMLAERLQSAGFRTMGVASHFYFQRRFGLAQGFQTWDLSASPPAEEQESTSADARVADRAIAQLEDPAVRAGRFFLWVHFFDPHKQYVHHPEFAAFGDNERARYDGEVAWTDRQLGRLLTTLDAQPFGRRTVVVVTADHGEAFNEHGMSWHGIELWEELVRVPLIVYVPGFAARRIDVPRSQIDLLPTLLELLRVPTPAPDAPDRLSGVSLVPDLLGEPPPQRPIYIELPEGPFNSMRRSVIDGGWKLTERGARHFELYHLATDPGEHTNLAPSAPEDLARMRGILEQVRGRLSVPTAPATAGGGS